MIKQKFGMLIAGMGAALGIGMPRMYPMPSLRSYGGMGFGRSRSKFMPHQGNRERERRLRNIGRGMENAALYIPPAKAA